MMVSLKCYLLYLVVLAVPVDHPVLPVGADLQFKGSDVVGLLRLLGNGPLRGDPRQHLQEVEVDLENEAEKSFKTQRSNRAAV